MIGCRGPATRWTVFVVAAAVVCLVLLGASPLPRSSLAAPPTTGWHDTCVLTIAAAADPDGTSTISGSLRTGSGGVADAPITMVSAGQQVGAATTADDGTFSASLSLRDAGDHVVTVTSAAVAHCPAQSQNATVTIARRVDLLVDAPQVDAEPGGSVTVSGRLLAQSQAFPEALVSLIPSWDPQGAVKAMTDADGTFVSSVTAPAEVGPGPFTVTVSFPGDGYYPATQVNVNVVVSTAAPAPAPTTASPTPPPSAPPTASASTVPAADVVPPWQSNSHLFIVLLVFVIVAALATGILLIIGVVSRQRRGLAADERRGFGSDFGVADERAPADDGLSGLGFGDPANGTEARHAR